MVVWLWYGCCEQLSTADLLTKVFQLWSNAVQTYGKALYISKALDSVWYTGHHKINAGAS